MTTKKILISRRRNYVLKLICVFFLPTLQWAELTVYHNDAWCLRLSYIINYKRGRQKVLMSVCAIETASLGIDQVSLVAKFRKVLDSRVVMTKCRLMTWQARFSWFYDYL